MKIPLLFLSCVLLLAACAAPAPAPTASPSPTASPVPPAASPAPSVVPAVSPLPASASPSPASTPVPPTSTPGPNICPPLDGMAWEELEDRLTNPFRPPRPGSDDPHQGIDLADFVPGSRVAVRGLGVQAVMAGTVSTVLDGRFPFGYGVIVESPLTGPLASALPLPPASDGTPPPTTLSCPGVLRWDAATGSESLYLLYAHLDGMPVIEEGERVGCGDPIGEIGDSGNALNPHVHLELRVGPSGASFPGMTHYNPAATEAEMDAYCAWRVSGLFRLIDPGALLLLHDQP